jgi:hypothetical protein
MCRTGHPGAALVAWNAAIVLAETATELGKDQETQEAGGHGTLAGVDREAQFAVSHPDEALHEEALHEEVLLEEVLPAMYLLQEEMTVVIGRDHCRDGTLMLETRGKLTFFLEPST